MNRQFYLTILGSNSAVPAYGRFPTCQSLRINNWNFLIDCGEGSQIRLSQYKIRKNSISHIFISHLHGDHIYGLPGLIGSMSLTSRTLPLTIYGPSGLKKMMQTIFELSHVYLNFELEIIEIKGDGFIPILDEYDVKVSAFPVFHRIETYGYLFEEKLPQKNLRKEAISEYNLSIEEIKLAKKGCDIPRTPSVISNDLLTLPSPRPVSYAFCADSEPLDELLPFIQHTSVIYFETTYLDDLADQAKIRGHATAKSAAILANKAQPNLLITGHYSSRYKYLDDFKAEAEAVFQPVLVGRDGEMVNLLDYE